jgi:thiamine kinase-like enzyme
VRSLLQHFKDAPPDAFVAERVTGGITNTIYRISINGVEREDATVLVRIFGAEGVISAEERAVENSVFAQLAEAKLAPPLLGVFANGRIEQWLPARCVTLDEMRDDDVMRGVAACMSDLHRFCPAEERGSERSASVWELIDKWIGVGRKLNLAREACDLDALASEVGVVRRAILEESPPSPLVFAHGDLLASNILLSLDGLRRISLIDFEYSCTCYRGFDIGNFWCEAMGGTSNGIVDCSKYPSARSQKLFCQTYLQVVSTAADTPSPSENEVDELMREANQYGLVSHLYWAAWAVAQSATSTIDFPYLLFSRERFAQYCNSKDRYLSREAVVPALQGKCT